MVHFLCLDQIVPSFLVSFQTILDSIIVIYSCRASNRSKIFDMWYFQQALPLHICMSKSTYSQIQCQQYFCSPKVSMYPERRFGKYKVLLVAQKSWKAFLSPSYFQSFADICLDTIRPWLLHILYILSLYISLSLPKGWDLLAEVFAGISLRNCVRRHFAPLRPFTVIYLAVVILATNN